MWRLPYKLVTKKLNRCPPGTLTAGRKLDLAAQPFPRCPETKWEEVDTYDPRGLPANRSTAEDRRLFTMAELLKAGKRLPGDKTPGLDLMPNEILKIFLREDPEALLSLFNANWEKAAFPSRWKKAKLVLLYKGGREHPRLNQPFLYRSV